MPDHLTSAFNNRRVFVTDDNSDPIADFSLPINTIDGNKIYDFTLSNSAVIKALVGQAGWLDTEIVSQEYVLQCDSPTLTPGGVYTDSLEVSMSTGTTGGVIYYTTDGSEPSEASMEYTSSFTITESTTVRALCTKTDFEDSDVTTAAYVIEEAPTQPEMSTQPQSQAVNACQTATLSGMATGTPELTYQWFKDGVVIGGEVEPELEIPAARKADAGDYTLVVLNSAGSVTSSIATLTVNGDDSACTEAPPTIVTQPLTQSAAACSAVTLSVAATGPSPLSYQWMKDGSDIQGETGTSLIIDPATSADGGKYSVRVSNSFGSTTSDEATLTITGDDSSCTNQPPAFVTQPVSQTVTACNSVTFTSSVNGTRPFTYKWSKDGIMIADATESMFTIDQATLADAGAYTLTVSNSFGEVTSTAATLTVTGDDSACKDPTTGSTKVFLPVIVR